MRKEEEISFSGIFCKFVSHILFCRLAKYGAEEKTHSQYRPFVLWQPWVEKLLLHPAPFLHLGSMVQRGKEMTWKRERGLTLMWSPGEKPVASIRIWETLSALSKMLSRKYIEKVVWSVCKDLSPFPFFYSLEVNLWGHHSAEMAAETHRAVWLGSSVRSWNFLFPHVCGISSTSASQGGRNTGLDTTAASTSPFGSPARAVMGKPRS